MPDGLGDKRYAESDFRGQTSAYKPGPLSTHQQGDGQTVQDRSSNKRESGSIPSGHVLPRIQGLWGLQPSSLERSTRGGEPPPSVDLAHQTTLPDFHGSTKLSTGNIQMPESNHNPLPPAMSQSDFNLLPTFAGQGVPDLSAMMFPSADPFAYPNQPMTTLENRHFVKQEHHMDPSSFDLPATSANATDVQYANVDAQIYDQMSPYVMQGQPNGLMQGIDPSTSGNSGHPAVAPMTAPVGSTGVWPQRDQRQPDQVTGVNYDQLFGEDWGGWMNYRQ